MENTQPLMDKKCNISLYISRVALEKRYKVFIDHLKPLVKSKVFDKKNAATLFYQNTLL